MRSPGHVRQVLGWFLSAVVAASVAWSVAAVIPRSEPLPPTTLRILVGSELEDLLSSDLMTKTLRDDTGITLEHVPAGSLEGAELIAQDQSEYDLAWFASDAYVRLLEEAPDVTTSEPVMTSSVVVAVEAEKADDLGWADGDSVSWSDVAAAVDDGFRFAMTDPEYSNSGFSALVSVAEADESLVSEVFAGQAARPTSSGFLTDQYRAGAFDVDGMINYESEVLRLNAESTADEDLVLVHPGEGSVVAEYPVMLLDPDEQAAYDELVRWLRQPAVQEQLSAETFMRPAVGGVPQNAAIGSATPTSIPLPATLGEVEAVLDTYVDEVGPVSRTVFVLDMSGSMNDEMSTTCPRPDEQTRLGELKCAFGDLTRDPAEADGGFPTLRQDERVILLPYRAQPLEPTTEVMDAQQDRSELVSTVNALTGAGGRTAMYDALVEAYELAAEDAQHEDPDREYLTSVVLITDGASNTGLGKDAFLTWWNDREDTLSSHDAPLFVAMLGADDADQDDLEDVAGQLGGAAVDVYGPTTLPDVIRRIREQQ